MSADKLVIPDKSCPIHGTPMRRCGMNYYCDLCAPARASSSNADVVAELRRLQADNEALAVRVAAQIELLTGVMP